MVLKDVRPIIAELVQLKKSIPLEIDVGRYLPEIRKNTHGEAVRGGIKKALRLIEQAPAIEAETVRHGEWVETKLPGFLACSACGLERHKSLNLGAAWRFCPKCGARLDGGKKDG